MLPRFKRAKAPAPVLYSLSWLNQRSGHLRAVRPSPQMSGHDIGRLATTARETVVLKNKPGSKDGRHLHPGYVRQATGSLCFAIKITHFKWGCTTRHLAWSISSPHPGHNSPQRGANYHTTSLLPVHHDLFGAYRRHLIGRLILKASQFTSVS